MISAALSPAYQAARNHAGLLLRDRGLLVVSGRDRASYLQGLFTNDIARLAAGQGCYAAYLTAQGRMLTDVYVYELGDVMLLALPRATKDLVLSKLDQFIFSEDVQLGDVTDTSSAVAVVGPDAASCVKVATGVDASGLGEHGNLRFSVAGQSVIVLRITDTGEPGFELVVSREYLPALQQALRAAGAVDLDAETADLLRLEEGIPLFGRDMDDETIPLEAGIEPRAISFTKGCYVGQEVIIRVLHRGHGRVARKLVGLVMDPAHGLPPVGTSLHVDDAPIGRITSCAHSARLGRPIALAYVKRDFTEPGTRVALPDGAVAQVVALPFVRS